MLLPGVIGAPELVHRARWRVVHGGAKAFPEEDDADVARLNAQDRIDQPLWALRVKARIGLRFPSSQFQSQPAFLTDAAIEFVNDRGQDVPVCLQFV